MVAADSTPGIDQDKFALLQDRIARNTMRVRCSLAKLHSTEKATVISAGSSMQLVDFSDDLAHSEPGANPFEGLLMYLQGQGLSGLE